MSDKDCEFLGAARVLGGGGVRFGNFRMGSLLFVDVVLFAPSVPKPSALIGPVRSGFEAAGMRISSQHFQI